MRATASDVAEATARLAISLSKAELQQLIAGTDVLRGQAAEMLSKPSQQAVAAWQAAGRAVQIAVVRAAQKPGATPSKILRTAEVTKALAEFDKAATKAKAAAGRAWDAGRVLGAESAVQQLGVLGVKPKAAPAARAVAPSILGDIDRNARDMRSRLLRVMKEQPRPTWASAIARETGTSARNVRMSVEASGMRGVRTSQVESLKAAGVRRKLWVTRFGPGTCPTCASLHGHIAPINGGFRYATTFRGKAPKPYLDLAGPPRHPNCRCVIVPLPDDVHHGASPQTMKAFARKWWKDNGNG